MISRNTHHPWDNFIIIIKSLLVFKRKFEFENKNENGEEEDEDEEMSRTNAIHFHIRLDIYLYIISFRCFKVLNSFS